MLETILFCPVGNTFLFHFYVETPGGTISFPRNQEFPEFLTEIQNTV